MDNLKHMQNKGELCHEQAAPTVSNARGQLCFNSHPYLYHWIILKQIQDMISFYL